MNKCFKILITVSMLSFMSACTSNNTAAETTSSLEVTAAASASASTEATEAPVEETVSTEETDDDLDAVYNNSAAQEYIDIRKLPQDYTSEDAKEDNCFVFDNIDVYNELLYRDFMNSYIVKQSAFIRVVHTTEEGDPVITDVLYDSDTDIAYVVNDASRDTYAGEERAAITLKEYETIGVWQDEESTYWIAFNNEYPEDSLEDINEDDLFIIATIG